MSKGLRKETKQWIETERDADPLALGPFLGSLAIELNVSTTLLAVVMGVHEQTVYYWITRRRPIHPKWSSKVIKVLSVLCWMHDTKHRPLAGTATQQGAQLEAAFTSFFALVKTIQKTSAEA